MKFKSLGLNTDWIFHQLEALMTREGQISIIKTQSRPDYYWGNYLISKKKVSNQKELDELVQIYQNNFNQDDYMTVAFDLIDGDIGDLNLFKTNGFRVYELKVLSTQNVVRPPKMNHEIEMRIIDIEKEMDDLIEVHFDENWRYENSAQIPFLKDKFNSLLKMEKEGLGNRYGAYLNNKLVADLGIYCEGELGRFNDVCTHKNFRRRGICGSLVYFASQYVFEKLGIKTLVMQAEEDYHAKDIYLSVGFKETEMLRSIEKVKSE